MVSFSTPTDRSPLRPEIASSWRRSEVAGVSPESHLDRLEVAEVPSSSRLIRAALPVLERLSAEFDGLAYSLLLGDAGSRIVGRWFDHSDVDRGLQRVGAIAGARWRESDVGTNGIGTPLETRTRVWIHGGEHFARVLSEFSCVGHPILHPITRRAEGVLNLTTRPGDEHPLFASLLTRAADDIQERLLQTSRAADTQLFRAFQEADRRGRMVIALNANVMLTSRAALGVIEEHDVAMLRELASSHARHPHGSAATVTMSAGAEYEVRIERLTDDGGGAIIRLRPRSAARVVAPLVSALSSPAPPGVAPADAHDLDVLTAPHVYVGGEPGTGRSTAAGRLVGDRSVVVFDARDVLVERAEVWAQRLTAAAQDPESAVVVESVHTLPDGLVDVVERVLETAPTTRIVLTGHPGEWLTARVQHLRNRCHRQIELPPLHTRRSEIPVIAADMVAAIDPGRRRPLGSGLAQLLAAHPWPGNLAELRRVLETACATRSTGALEITDLPAAYHSPPVRRLAARERAEREAIIEALRRHGGNKSRAATYLGVTRSTLYNRLRALEIADVAL